MNIIKAVNLVFDYIRRDEEGQVEEVKRALDHVNLEIEKGRRTIPSKGRPVPP